MPSAAAHLAIVSQERAPPWTQGATASSSTVFQKRGGTAGSQGVAASRCSCLRFSTRNSQYAHCCYCWRRPSRSLVRRSIVVSLSRDCCRLDYCLKPNSSVLPLCHVLPLGPCLHPYSRLLFFFRHIMHLSWRLGCRAAQSF